jgi:putative hemolysin
MPSTGFWFLLIGLLILSAFASSSETSFFSLNRFLLRRIRETNMPAYERIRTLLSHPSRLLILILILNELVNVTFSSLVASHVDRYFPDEKWVIATIVALFASIAPLLLFGEITPKIMATRMNRVIVQVHSKILIFLYRILFPILWILDWFISTTLKKFNAQGKDYLTKTMSVMSEEDILVLMEEGQKQGSVDSKEQKLIQNVFEFDDSLVEEVLTPIDQVFSISASAKLKEILPLIKQQKFSRIPVYQKNKKNIVGLLFVKDLLLHRTMSGSLEQEVKHFMEKPLYIKETVHLSSLFKKFKSAKAHLAVVLNDDKEESVIGIVTMEDLLERIFGEIEDERDVQ